MENEEAQAEESSHPPGMVSQVELSYVALNMKQINPSQTDHLVKAAPPGVTRNSIRDGEIKIRVKSFSTSEPKLDQESTFAEEGEDIEYEHEQDLEQQNEEEGDQMGETGPHEFPSLTSHMADVEDESNAETVPTTPPSTPRGENEFALLDDMENEGEGAGESEEGEEEPSSSDAQEDELKNENIHHTLLEKECVIPEVIIVWEYISKFIIQKMLEGFAVKIPGVGAFSHSVLPNDVMKNKKDPGKFALRKTRKFPVFKICPHLKEMYRLSEENYLYQCNTPTVPLNVAVVACNAKLTPGFVEGIIIETLQSFVTGIITNKMLEFPFPFIGKLFIKQRQVFMMFYQQFCEGLSFDFEYAPSYISSVFPGNMTPLAYHRPSSQFHSVFHFCDVRSVEDKITARPRPYASGKLLLDDSASENPCEFMSQLYTHSNLLYDCSCCKSSDANKQKLKYENDDDNDSGNSTPPCRYSKNFDRIRRACCTQEGRFAFQKPDGSTFTPELLYKTAKTGNPILDRLSDDRCLLQQAIGCWMKRKVVQTLGTEDVKKHYDREYFRNRLQASQAQGKKSYLIRDQASPVATRTPSVSSTQGGSANNLASEPKPRLSRKMTTLLSRDNNLEDLAEEEEENEISGMPLEDFSSTVTRAGSMGNVKNIRSKSYRMSNKSNPPAEVMNNMDEENTGANKKGLRNRSSMSVHPNDSFSMDEFEQNE